MRKPMLSLVALPTLVTLGNAFCGFLAATYILEAIAVRGHVPPGAPVPPLFYEYMIQAVWAMLVAMVFDFLDGKVARITGSESAFGVQIDSLSDVISFGLVPAFMFKALYEFEFGATGKSSLILACFYLFGAVLRLARFNVEADLENDDHRSFRGLPSPAAAAGVAALVFLYCSSETRSPDGILKTIFPYYVSLLGILMWTKLPYIHVVSVALTERRHDSHLLLVLGCIAAVFWEPPIAITVLTVGYALSGPLLYVWNLCTGRASVEGESLL